MLVCCVLVACCLFLVWCGCVSCIVSVDTRSTSLFPKPEKWVDWLLTLRGAVAGVGVLGLSAVAINRLSHRANRKFACSLLNASHRQQRDASPFVSRGNPFPRVPTGRATIFQGRHLDGKSVTLSHAILKQWYPWYWRLFWPSRGFYLEGSQTSETAQSWLSKQLATGSEDPLTHIQDLVEERASQQRVRTLMLEKMPWLPSFCHPQPSVIIIDRAEELIRRYRADFLVLVKELVRINCNCPSTLQVIFVVNTNEAVQSLQNLNGGDLFEPVVQCPTPNVAQVEAALGKKVAGFFVKFDNRLGVAMSYNRLDVAMSYDGATNPADKFFEEYQASYKKDVEKTVTKDEIGELTDGAVVKKKSTTKDT